MNPLVVDTGSPPIPQVQAWRASYAGGFGPSIDLSQAVPGYPPHPAMLEKLAEAAGSSGAAQYGAILGDENLREAYAADLSAIYGGRVGADNVAVTAGCNQAYVAAIMALAKAGDAVLLPSPWYFNHAMTLDMLGIDAKPLPCAPEAGFVPDPELAETLLDERVKAIVLVTPNNPTGATYPPEVIERFSALCRRRGIRLILDETYRDFMPGSLAPHGLFADPEWRRTLVQLYSFSKAYCIPGHRVGAIAAEPAFLAQVTKIQDCIQICPPRVGQMALAWAIDALRQWRAGNTAEILARTEAFRKALTEVPEWRVDAVGAYFAYVRYPFEGVTATEVAGKLATERGVICLPGSYFGPDQDRHLRLAFANVDVPALAGLPRRLAGLEVG